MLVYSSNICSICRITGAATAIVLKPPGLHPHQNKEEEPFVEVVNAFGECDRCWLGSAEEMRLIWIHQRVNCVGRELRRLIKNNVHSEGPGAA